MSVIPSAVDSFENENVEVSPAAAPEKKAKKFDIARYRAASMPDETRGMSEAQGAKQTQFPVRKPGSKLFFRAHPDENFCLYGLPAVEDSEKNFYLLDPDFEAPENFERFVTSVNLACCVNHKQTVFLWPFKNSTNEWTRSAKTVLRKARSEWVRIQANMDANGYKTEDAPEELAAVQPKWPDLTFEQIIEKAFEGRIIQDENNPVVRELQGKV